MPAGEKLGDETEPSGSISGRAQHAQRLTGEKSRMTRVIDHQLVLLGCNMEMGGSKSCIWSHQQRPDLGGLKALVRVWTSSYKQGWGGDIKKF